jgi:hypothetical protein
MTNDELDRSVTAKINSDPALVAYKLASTPTRTRTP